MLPGSSQFPKPRGLVVQGGASASWDGGRAAAAGAGAGCQAAFGAPPPRHAATDDFDSLDALLGGGAGSVTGASPAQQSSRPFTAVRTQAETSVASRPAPHAQLFADDESLPLPDDEREGHGSPLQPEAPAASQAQPAAMPPSQPSYQQPTQPSLSQHAPSARQQPQQPQQQHYAAPQVHANPAFQLRPDTAGSTAAAPASAAVPVFNQPAPTSQHQQHFQQEIASLRGSLVEQQRMLEEQDREFAALRQQCQAAEGGEAAARSELAAAQEQVAQLQEQLEGTNEAAMEQMLAEVDRLAAAKQLVEGQAAALRKEVEEERSRAARAEEQGAQAAAELEAARKQLAEEQQAVQAAREEAEQQGQELEAAKSRLVAAEAAAAAGAAAASELAARKAELAAATKQLSSELEECREHLAAGQEIMREFEGHLRTVAAERDAALEQLQFVEGRREEADRRLREAERKEAYNARRQDDLDALQAEADGVVHHLREEQQAFVAREREAAAREKQLGLREKDLSAREAALKEQQAEASRQQDEAQALRQQLLGQQQEVERGRAQLSQQRSALEATQAQVQRDQAAIQQERSLLADLRSQRMAEQETIISQLAEERAAAARQQASAERAVDAARGAELAAQKLLSDLQAQASSAKHAAEAAEKRLSQLEERCAAEEGRLAALQAAVLEQRQGFDAQVRSLLDMGQQVKGQSEELSVGYSQLQASQAELERQQAALKEEQAKTEAEAKAAKVAKGAAEGAAQRAAEAQLEAAAEQRKMGQARLENLRAAEVARELQLRLAAHVRAAAAAGVPGASDVWAQLASAMGASESQLGAMAASQAAMATAAGPSQPQYPLQSFASMPPPSPAAAAAPARASQQQPVAAPAAFPVAAAPEETRRYNSLLADLEGSIQRWRTQLRAGQQLTFDGCGSPGVGSFYLAGPGSAPAAAAGIGGASLARSGKAATDAGRRAGKKAAQQQRNPAASEDDEEDEDGGKLKGQDSWEEGGEELGAEAGSPSKCRGVQTAVSYIDAPRAVAIGSGKQQASHSVPCSPAKHRAGGGQQGGRCERPASAGAAVPVRGSSSSMSRLSGGGKHSAAGEVRAVQGLTIPAEYSLPGSPQHAKPRRWLKFKGSCGEGEGDGAAKSGWGGIFAFRRLDGAPGKQ